MMPKSHELKIWSDFFNDVASGKKPFELRRDDRQFDVGDTLHLQEFRPAVGEYTGRTVDVVITYIMRSSRNTTKIGLPQGFCIIGIKIAELSESSEGAAPPNQSLPLKAQMTS